MQDVLLPAIAEKFGPGGGTISGPIISTYSPAITVKNDVGQLLFKNTADNSTTGVLSFNHAGFITLAGASGSAGIQITQFGHIYSFDTEFYANGFTDLGKPLSRWGTVYGLAGNFSGAVTAASFVGDGSGLTGVPGATLTGAAIISALGYTPYPTSNPAGYQTSSGSVALASTATTAGTAAKANVLNNAATGGGLVFSYTAGVGPQPSWVWGGSDGINNFVWNPSNFSVAYALTAGSAGSALTAGSVSAPASNGYGNRTVSTSDPSGGSDGDVWFKY